MVTPVRKESATANPKWEGFNTGDRGTAYRFHLPDPVTFKKSVGSCCFIKLGTSGKSLVPSKR